MKNLILTATLIFSLSVASTSTFAKSKSKAAAPKAAPSAEMQKTGEAQGEQAGVLGTTTAVDSANLLPDQKAEKELSSPVLTVTEDESQGLELTNAEIKDMKSAEAVASLNKVGAEATAESTAQTEANDNVESEIPVFKKAEKQAAVEPESATTKLLMTLGILCVVFGVAYVGLKRFSKREQKSADPLRIKVLGQHFLSPKRSLLVVQIAGETLLLGATDQNINLLKNLSLLDEDIPLQTPTQFDTSLKNHSMDEELDENFALQGLSEVRDRVTKKLSEMRNL